MSDTAHRYAAAQPLGFFVLTVLAIGLAWWWLGAPVALPPSPLAAGEKLYCVSYAPFRDGQDPLVEGTKVTAAQIDEDMALLSHFTDCVRTYSVDDSGENVLISARRYGLKVLHGIWVSNETERTRRQIAATAELAKKYADVIRGIVVGNEVLLRGEMSATDLEAIIRDVKSQVTQPVTYADVWEFWLRYADLRNAVDFVTIHILPYWEDFPIPASHAGEHVVEIRKKVAAAIPNKEILIGETGWPSAGRMREGALPSRTNQARVVSEILDLAKRENFRVNLIEAYDQPWKRELEGTVGGYWGLFDSVQRALKYPPGVAISNYPLWKLQMGCGMGLSFCIFGAAWLTLRRRPWTPRPASWIAVGIFATACGILLGVAADKMFYESYGFGGWLRWGALLAAGVAAPLLGASALMSGRAAPTFLELLGPREDRTRSVSAVLLGLTLIVTVLVGAESALGFVFDPRYKDFPFAALTMAVLPFALLTLLNRPQQGPRPIAEAVFAGLFAMAALFTLVNEGFNNWQSMWTCALYLLLGLTLWQARGVQTPK